MAIFDSTNIKDPRVLYSQTPPDFSSDNYFLDTLQKKIDADWPYRPNRKWVEEEEGPGTEKYNPLEVVVQTIKNDKGEAISDDWYRLVFRDCRKQVRMGKRYRFSYSPNINCPDIQKNIWLAVNQTQLTTTASQTICRCNGTIGSLYIKDDGTIVKHYEPVVQPEKLSAAGVFSSEVAIDINGKKMIIAQFNKYTQQYYVNQRFFIDTNAYDALNQPVYKITNIVRSNTLTTYDPTDVGLVRIYYEVDQIGEKDDIANRIAYNGDINVEVTPQSDTPSSGGGIISDYYIFTIVNPKTIPETLDILTFQPALLQNGSIVNNATISVDCYLEGTSYASSVPLSKYISFVDNGDGTYTITRIKKDTTMKLKVSCVAKINSMTYNLDFFMKLF